MDFTNPEERDKAVELLELILRVIYGDHLGEISLDAAVRGIMVFASGGVNEVEGAALLRAYAAGNPAGFSSESFKRLMDAYREFKADAENWFMGLLDMASIHWENDKPIFAQGELPEIVPIYLEPPKSYLQ